MTDDVIRKFSPENVPRVLETCDQLIALHTKQIEIVKELKRSMVHECTRHFDDPEARAVFIAIKEAELAAQNKRVDEHGRLWRLDNGKRVYTGMNTGYDAERIVADIKRAREYANSTNKDDNDNEATR